MRLKKVEINPQSGKIEIDTYNQDKPFIVVISSGKAKVTELPDHGETIVVTHQSKVKRVKYEEGEEF